MNGWSSAEVTQDGIALIKMTRSISNQHDESKQGVMEIFQSYKRMFLTYQTPDMSNKEYFGPFKACVDVIKSYGGTPGSHPVLTKDLLAEITAVDIPHTLQELQVLNPSRKGIQPVNDTWHVYLLVGPSI